MHRLSTARTIATDWRHHVLFAQMTRSLLEIKLAEVDREAEHQYLMSSTALLLRLHMDTMIDWSDRSSHRFPSFL